MTGSFFIASRYKVMRLIILSYCDSYCFSIEDFYRKCKQIRSFCRFLPVYYCVVFRHAN